MSRFNVYNSRESANLIHNFGDFINKMTKESDTDLVRVFSLALADGWRNGQTALHVHVRVRLVGESVADDLCWLFQRKSSDTFPLLKQDRFGVPANSLANIFSDKRRLHQQGSVLIKVGETSNNTNSTGVKRDAEVWLRLLDDCPRVSIDLYPIKNAKLWLTLSELNIIEEPFLAVIDRELIPPTWFMTIAKDKLEHKMVKSATEIVKNISGDNRKPNIGFRERLSLYNIPGAITPYIEHHSIGVLFDPSVNLRFESAVVLFGPPEFGSDPHKVGNSCTHMLQYPKPIIKAEAG